MDWFGDQSSLQSNMSTFGHKLDNAIMYFVTKSKHVWSRVGWGRLVEVLTQFFHL